MSKTVNGVRVGESNHAYYAKLAALLDPYALETLQTGAFTYAVASNVTKYLLASWSTRIASAGRMEVRDPRTPLPLRGVTLNGLEVGSIAVFLDPTLPNYADARNTYFDNLNTIATSQTHNVDLNGSGASALLLPGPYGTMILRVVNFDYAWVIGQHYAFSTSSGYNLANEVADTTIQRNDNSLMLPCHKWTLTHIKGSAHAGLATVVYVQLPSTWSGVADSNIYAFRDDFMGATLNTAATWNRTQTAGGNMEIDTNFQWLKIIGSGAWGTNGIYSQASIARAAGKVFMADIYVGDSNDPGIMGFSDGGGYSYTNFAHGVNFGGGSTLTVFENGNSRGAVGSGWSANQIYRVRVTLGASSAAYAIQGGAYPRIGGSTWTDITPGTTSSTTTPLYAGFTSYDNNANKRLSDVRIY